MEEAGEVWLAAEHESDEALAQEISQLIYHLQSHESWPTRSLGIELALYLDQPVYQVA